MDDLQPIYDWPNGTYLYTPIDHYPEDHSYKNFKAQLSERGIKGITERRFSLALQYWGERGGELNGSEDWSQFIEFTAIRRAEIIKQKKLY